MSSSVLELSILKLTSPRKRVGQSARYTYENDLGQSLGAGSIFSPTKSKALDSLPPPWFADDDLFTIFEQHRAAVPFKWEAIPGTRRDQDQEIEEVQSDGSHGLKDMVLSDSDQENSSSSSPAFTLSPSSSTNGTSRTSSSRSSVSLLEEPRAMVQAHPEFQVNPIQLSPAMTPTTTPTKEKSLSRCSTPGSTGSALALKPPPGMQSIKQLLSLECEDRGINTYCFSSRSVNSLINSGGTPTNGSSITNLKSHQRRSFRRDGLKALPFLSTPKEHAEDPLACTTMLGFEEWSKVVLQQEKEEKQEKQQDKQQGQQQEKKLEKEQEKQPGKQQEYQLKLKDSAQIKGPHDRTLSMPRLAFSFRKKSAEKEGDSEDIFNEDFGKKGGLRERRPFSSVSSRTLSDGYTPKSRNWVLGEEDDYFWEDEQVDERSQYVDCTEVIGEENEKVEALNNAKNQACEEDGAGAQTPTGKRRSDALNRLRRIFKTPPRSSIGVEDQVQQQKAIRLSSVSPASPPPLALAQGDLRLKKSAQQNKEVTKAVSSSPILKICMSNPIGQALLKNVRQLRSFKLQTHRPRVLTFN